MRGPGEPMPGCDMNVTWTGNSFKGVVKPGKQCLVFRKDRMTYLDNSFEISEQGLISVDRGLDTETDQLVWGSIAGPFEFVRRTSLDELPQFWNVITGEMSLVGTRPPTPDEVERYDVPQWQRLDVKPGMTGEWQVNGRSQVRNFEEVIQLDLRYQENWSLGYDLRLIFKTILILFQKNSGAF